MAYENKNFEDNNNRNNETLFSKRIKAGKRRTYFFDVRSTRSNDFFITITESKKRFDDNGYDRHKMFLYKEDFNKFLTALTETINHVKTELMPDFDFDAYNHDQEQEQEEGATVREEVSASIDTHTHIPVESSVIANNDDSSVDDWKM